MRILVYDWALHSIGGGQKFDCKIAEHLSKKHDVDILTLFSVDKKKLENAYAVNFSRIKKFRHLYKKAVLNPSLLVLLSSRKVSKISKQYDLFFNADAIESVKPNAKYNIMYCHFFGLKWPKPAKSFTDFLKLSLRWLLKTIFKNYAGDYDAIYCNSSYTKKWLKKIWEVDASVIYPPIDIPKKIEEFSRKKKVILSLGRLTPDKNYEFTIECFKKVYDSLPESENYECWICGTKPSKEYYERLRNLAAGYPIKIIITSNNKQLNEIYNKSKIFIQAKGIGIDEKKYPAMLEHFGMTPVEAMAHGVVPIVLNKGGYKESVQNGVSGFLFDTKEEAAEKLKLLIQNQELLQRMSRNASQRAKKFSLERMQHDLDRMMEKIKID